jgi:hypothetical protein
MRVVVGWFRGSRDAYFEVYEVDDEFWRVLEEVDNDPDCDPDRDLAYYVRGEG